MVIAAAVVVVAVVALALLSKWSESSSNVFSPQFIKTIKDMVSQSNRFSSLAMQDQNLLMALMHINFGLGFLKATRRIAASDADIQKITGTNVAELHYMMEEQQAQLIAEISQTCPDLKMEGVFALNAGWTGGN